MELYLVRHAEAVEQTEGLDDQVRWLTPRGRKLQQRAAARLHKKQVRPELVITSPLTRAVQTAELLLPELGRRTKLIADNRLSADATVEGLLELLKEQGAVEQLLLVGHEPLLSGLAAALLEKELAFPFAKSGCLALQLRDKKGKPARFLWYTPANGKTIRSAKKACVPHA